MKMETIVNFIQVTIEILNGSAGVRQVTGGVPLGMLLFLYTSALAEIPLAYIDDRSVFSFIGARCHPGEACGVFV